MTGFLRRCAALSVFLGFAVYSTMLDNFDHIKAYWIMLGKATAQTALQIGANDLDGTITDGGELAYSYSVESGGEVKMTRDEIIETIQRAGSRLWKGIRFTIWWKEYLLDRVIVS